MGRTLDHKVKCALQHLQMARQSPNNSVRRAHLARKRAAAKQANGQQSTTGSQASDYHSDRFER